jgi:hypothetical protein
MMDQPHRVDVEVRDDDHLPAREPFLRFEPRNDLGGQKVRADYQVRLVLAKQFYERARVQFVERETASFVLPRLVELVVKPAGHFRHFVD